MALLVLGIILTFYTMVGLSASFIVWSVSAEAEFLKGNMNWSNWDVEELTRGRGSWRPRLS